MKMQTLMNRGEIDEWINLNDRIFHNFLKSEEGRQMGPGEFDEVIKLYRAVEGALYKAHRRKVESEKNQS